MLIAKPHVVSIAKTPYYVKHKNTKNPIKIGVFVKMTLRYCVRQTQNSTKALKKIFMKKLLNNPTCGAHTALREAKNWKVASLKKIFHHRKSLAAEKRVIELTKEKCTMSMQSHQIFSIKTKKMYSIIFFKNKKNNLNNVRSVHTGGQLEDSMTYCGE